MATVGVVLLLGADEKTQPAKLRAPVDPRCWADEFTGQREACCKDAAVGADLGCWGGRFLYGNCCLGALVRNEHICMLEPEPTGW